MIRRFAHYALFAAVLLVFVFDRSVSCQAEEITVIDSINADDPGWKYLYTIDNGLAVDPTATPDFGFAVTGPGGAAIWAFPDFDTSAPVVGFVYDTIDTTFDVGILNWQDGSAPFHYGGVNAITGGGTVLDQPPGGQRRAQYFRKEFTVPVQLDHVMLDGIIDDVGVFYIDGVEVFRGGNGYDSPALISLPNEVPRFDDGASTDVGGEDFRSYGSLRPADPANGFVLSPGTHVFAVEVHQGGGTSGINSSDMGMSIRLYGNGSDVVGPSIDFNQDQAVDVADIDLLVGEIVGGGNGQTFDLSGDSVVDAADLTKWLSDAATHNGFLSDYLSGDSNLNGIVDAGDLNNLALNWQKNVASWSGGDFTADGVVSAGDLNALALNWQKSIPVAAASASPVPEPSACVLMLLGFGLLFRRTSVR